MTTIDLHDAIRAAMQDQFDRTGSTHVDRVEPVVRAALPHIEKAVREQVAGEIEVAMLRELTSDVSGAINNGMALAAHIARGGSDVARS